MCFISQKRLKHICFCFAFWSALTAAAPWSVLTFYAYFFAVIFFTTMLIITTKTGIGTM